MVECYAGLMSGTSMDAIDGVLADFRTTTPVVLSTASLPIPPQLRDDLRRLAQPGDDHLDLLGQTDHALGHLFAQVVERLQEGAKVTASAIRAVGSHGQTVRHRPQGARPFTLQIGDPNIIAQRTGICTVADFRRRDMAAGGQGAPLVPAFHAALLRTSDHDRVVLNLGGIANISILPADPGLPVSGFDTGPANTLLDAWIARHQQLPCDMGGRWAMQGHIDRELLERLLTEPYFNQRPPKSTGPELFNLAWLRHYLGGNEPAQDVQATLLALTVESVARAIERDAPHCMELIVCGGGVHNRALMAALEQRLSPVPVHSSTEHGIDPDWVEALAFAWLAHRTINGLPGNLPAVSGAREEVILGGIYPA